MTHTKNILIVALVIINVFFLAYFGWGVYRDNAVKKQMYRELYELMIQNGILLDTSNISKDGEMYRLDTTRDLVEEQRLAQTLLGETTAVEQGGSVITTYIGKSGQAVFRSGGEFDITFSESVFKADGNAERMTRKILKSIGIETVFIDVAATDGKETVTAVCAWTDFRIFDCRIQFTYINGRLVEISGKHVANIRVTADKTEMSASSAATALMGFLHLVKEGKYTCAAIMGVSPGYSFTAATYGDGSLNPVWRIDADSGVYYVDAVTGAVEQGVN